MRGSLVAVLVLNGHCTAAVAARIYKHLFRRGSERRAAVPSAVIWTAPSQSRDTRAATGQHGRVAAAWQRCQHVAWAQPEPSPRPPAGGRASASGLSPRFLA